MNPHKICRSCYPEDVASLIREGTSKTHLSAKDKTHSMKHGKVILTLVFMMGLGLLSSIAQQAIVAAGDEATGKGCNMSLHNAGRTFTIQ